ncbi:MAG TPA: Gfo/Idh/MocA family oxidoreductase, partial [Actinomycetes bacterium]
MTLRIGVVGTGMMGQDHIRRLAASVLRVEVVAVSDVNTEQARRAGDGVEARVYGDGHELIA